LIDVGLGPRAIQNRLQSVGFSWDRLSSALLTHTHGDHIDDGTMLRMAREGIALYCHEGHRGALTEARGFRALDEARLVRHYDDRPFLTPGGFRVEPLELRHDGGPTFGFRVEVKPARGRRSIALGYLADTGSWSAEMADSLAGVDVLGVEFNHDVDMQRRSPRHPALIARNLGDWGHLSNVQGAGFLAEVLERSGPGTVRDVVLLHLSQQCNHPELALKTAREAIRRTGRRLRVHAAQQSLAHPNVLVDAARRRSPARLVQTDLFGAGDR
jgi:phosphoribosyl 1,2-cyclic phosphodiesterase